MGRWVSVASYDAAWRQTATTSAMGVTSTQTWAPAKDLPLAVTDNVGRTTTKVYDATDRVTDTYGPATAACFQASGAPVGNPAAAPGCGILPAHVNTQYDGGLNGLQATYYPNKTLTGRPVLFATGTGDATGAVNRDWGTASPGGSIPADGWSLRQTGLITFPLRGATRCNLSATTVSASG